MRVRVFALGAAALLCVVPLMAQDYVIEAGNDVWNTPGGGSTRTILLAANWKSLCGVTAPDTSVTLKGYNIPGQGTGDTVIERLADADVADGQDTVPIRLKDLSFHSVGTHPCSPLTIWFREAATQTEGSMTITRTSATGGTFTASVPVSVVIEAKNSSGQVVGSIRSNGVFEDDSSATWSFTNPGGGVLGSAWFPEGTCRFGTETAPSTHCYEPATTCGVVIGTASASRATGNATATPVPKEPCSVEAEPVGQ